jgi:type IV pilus assembly protein PilV
MNHVHPARPLRHTTRGTSLVEVLVALLVLSFGVLGMAALHARALQFGIDAEDRNRAALLASEIVSTMWLQGSTALPESTLQAWQSKVQDQTSSGLPNASASVSTADAAGVVTVTVNWRPGRRAATNGDYQYVTRVVLP